VKTNSTNTIAEINNQDEAVLHLQTGFSPIDVNVTESEYSLPFNKLGGEGFERLCYQLLLAEGQTPHLFGKPGVSQYGIDLIVFDGNEGIVYQCKNLKAVSKSDLKDILEKFEKDWLEDRPQLPKPKKFILCIPLSLTEENLKDTWLKLKKDFYDRTKVGIDEWDLKLLNSKLKNLPDIVADLFSSRVAERFCNLPNWREDIFRPVKQGSGDLILKRYLTLKDAGRLYLGVNLRESFTEKLALDGSLLVQGLPGSGKSLTCLAFSEELNQRHFRVFYVNMQYDVNESDLFDGIKRRLTRPTVFLFDNCQGKYGLLENLYDRLAILPSIGKHRLIFISRTSSTGKDLPLKEYPSFVEIMKEKETLLTFQPSVKSFRKIIALAKPELMPLSTARLDKIYDITARDLFLLDQLLDIIQTPEDIDRLQSEDIYQATLKRYFGGETAYSEYLMNLSALCQFDLASPVGYLESQISKDDERAKVQLVIEADTPLRYYFIHSSAAELIYRALTWCEKTEDYHSKTAHYLIDYFKYLIVYFTVRKDGNQTVADELAAVLRNRLKLEENREKEYELKSLLLANDEIYTFINKNFTRFLPAFTVLSLTILKSTDEKTYQRYCDLLQKKVDDETLLSVIIKRNATQLLKYIKTEFPHWYKSLHTQFFESGLSTLIKTKDFRGVLRLFSSFTNALEDDFLITPLLATIDQDWQNMIQRTIDSKRSIGTIPFALRELKKTDKALLKQLEQKIGAIRYLKLIAESGTVFELFMILQYSSIAEELIESLDETFLDDLIEKTIKSKRSIGAIDLTLFELKKTDEDLLKQLEQKIGAIRYLKLIAESGTVSELFGIIRHSTLLMAEELIELLDETFLDDLIEKTIKSKRSIGTINLALRELKKTDEDLFNQLEQKIGAIRYLKLIAESGTVFELFSIIQRSSLSMAEELIESLDESFLNSLIEKTIKEERSIGTIDLALRELKKTDKDLLRKLERKISVTGWWRLIKANGDMGILCNLTRRMSFNFRMEMAAYAATFSPYTWAELIKRGDFKSLAAFVRWGVYHFPKLFSKKLLDELNPGFEELIARAQWSVLNQSAGWLEKSPNSAIKNHLQKLLKEYLQKIDTGKLKFESFSDATNYFGLLNHNILGQRTNLDLLFDILPEETIWYDDENFLRNARILFFTLTDSNIRHEDFIRILNLGNNEDVAPLFLQGTTQDIFLYLWNIYALWYGVESQKPKEQRKDFRNFLHPVMVTKVQEVLLQRLLELSGYSEPSEDLFFDDYEEQELSNSETITTEMTFLIALSGFLSSWSLINLEKEEREKIRAALNLDMLLKGIDETDSFLVAAFYLLGLEWLFGKLEKGIALTLAEDVLSKKDNYTLRTTKAMENLYKAVHTHYDV
jgi:AAA domain